MLLKQTHGAAPTHRRHIQLCAITISCVSPRLLSLSVLMMDVIFRKVGKFGKCASPESAESAPSLRARPSPDRVMHSLKLAVLAHLCSRGAWGLALSPRTRLTTLMSTAAAEEQGGTPPPRVLLLDVMDTLVADPFFRGMHRDVFGCETMKDLFAQKDEQAFLDFEVGARARKGRRMQPNNSHKEDASEAPAAALTRSGASRPPARAPGRSARPARSTRRRASPATSPTAASSTPPRCGAT